MKNIAKKIHEAFDKKFNLQPVQYEPEEVINAWSKINAVLDSAYLDTHVEAAQGMFNNMIRYFGITKEQRTSPLIQSMQAKINRTRATGNIIRVMK